MKALHLCGLSLALAAACSAGDRRVEPGDLDARDLLGVSSRLAARWDADERQAARDVLHEAWQRGEADEEVMVVAAPAGAALGDAESTRAALAAMDERRVEAGSPPIIAGVAQGGTRTVTVGSIGAIGFETDTEATGSARLAAIDWHDDELALFARGGPLLVDLASAAGHPAEEALAVRPARRQPWGAVYAGSKVGVLVNPVFLAALEPREGDAPPAPAAASMARTAGGAGASREGGEVRKVATSVGGNPYSFFGSVAECAAFHRLRCEACLPSGDCEQTSRDAADGNAECTTLAAENGRGYYLYCANLSLAIATVAECADGEAPGCGQDNDASNQLDELAQNEIFVDDPTCQAGLDQCLAEIYGEPDEDFPPPVGTDAGPPPPPPDPRQTETACSGSDVNCDFSPQCDADCSSSCEDVFSCDADCNGSGSSGGCDSCGGGGDTGSTGGDGCGGGDGCDCGGDSSSGSGSGCDCGSDGESGGGCGGDSGGGCGGSGGGCGGGSGGDCGGSGGGSGGGGCVVSGGGAAPEARARCRRSGGVAGLLALLWALAPIPYLERARRRARRRERTAAGTGGEP